MAGVAGGPGNINKSKYILRQFPIFRFYLALAISVFFFVIELLVCHAAHSLILQIDSYHMLYNILSLGTCILTAKASKQGNGLKNTFGWRRIDVFGAAANVCFLSALGFSVLVECLQTIFHASHHEKMHYPITVGIIGVVGLIVNLVIFLLIGGYTLHQSGSLCSTKDGRGNDSVISNAMRRGPYDHVKEREGFFGFLRDIFGSILVILVAVVVFCWGDDPNSDYVDPSVTITCVFILGLSSYKYAVEAGHILLLTIPHHINVTSLQTELKQHFPQVFDIHEFHIWQLTPARIIASIHVVLQKPHGYLDIQNNIIHFLHEKGISHVTMQPEFLQMTDGDGEIETPQTIRRRKCFLPCSAEDEDCHERKCCDDEDDHDHEDHDDDLPHAHSHSHSHNISQSSGSHGSRSITSPSSFPGTSIGVLKSESLNNHLDITSLDSIALTNDANTINAIVTNDRSATVQEDSDSDEELRPMI